MVISYFSLLITCGRLVYEKLGIILCKWVTVHNYALLCVKVGHYWFI